MFFSEKGKVPPCEANRDEIERDGVCKERKFCRGCKRRCLEKRSDPPCVAGEMGLMAENEDAFSVYFICQGQLIVDSGCVIDADINAVLGVIELLKVKDKRGCFEKVMKIFGVMIGKMNKKK